MDLARYHGSLFLSHGLQVRGKRAQEFTRLFYLLLGSLALGDIAVDAQEALHVSGGIEFRVDTPLEDPDSIWTFKLELCLKRSSSIKHISDHAFPKSGLLLGKPHVN